MLLSLSFFFFFSFINGSLFYSLTPHAHKKEVEEEERKKAVVFN